MDVLSKLMHNLNEPYHKYHSMLTAELLRYNIRTGHDVSISDMAKDNNLPTGHLKSLLNGSSKNVSQYRQLIKYVEEHGTDSEVVFAHTSKVVQASRSSLMHSGFMNQLNQLSLAQKHAKFTASSSSLVVKTPSIANIVSSSIGNGAGHDLTTFSVENYSNSDISKQNSNMITLEAYDK